MSSADIYIPYPLTVDVEHTQSAQRRHVAGIRLAYSAIPLQSDVDMISEMDAAGKQVCFVDMPFGVKTDPRSGIEIDFDKIYNRGIRPAIEDAGLQAIRGDQEQSGGVIHSAMFARLLLSEFVVADLTTANPNVFYELGVRHTAKPYTTIPIFATTSTLPFDVALVRGIPYELESGSLTDEAAEALRSSLQERIERALDGPVSKDSPLFQLFNGFPGIEMSHEVTDVFRERAEYSDQFRQRLRVAKSEGVEALNTVRAELGALKRVERGVLMDLFLSYRDVDAHSEMVDLYEQFPSSLRKSVVARQQFAFALNRRKGAGDEDRAIETLKTLLEETGESAETLGLLGRIYKDRYMAAKQSGDDVRAGAFLDQAIVAYTRGFEAEPMDYYPGINAVSLLVDKGTEEARQELSRLVPLVTFAAVRVGGAESDDYWTLATVLELGLIGEDTELVDKVLPRLLVVDSEPWMRQTTLGTVNRLLSASSGPESAERLQRVSAALQT